MARRTPNPHSPEEVRRALQNIQFDTAIITEGGVGEILLGAGIGNAPTWTTELTTLTLLTVDNITVNGAVITSDTGAISFNDENVSTTGTITGVNVTSGEDPGHTHTGASLTIDHGDDLAGLADDDHTQYSLVDGTRAFSGTVGGVTPVADADLTTKSYVDTEIEAALAEYDFEADDDISAGQPIYISATDHANLAYANHATAYKVIGLTKATTSSGNTLTAITDGKLELADWTDVIGLTTLTPGAIYYLSRLNALVDEPSYANAGGTGDRTALITVTISNTYNGTLPGLVDGSQANDFWFNAWPAAGEWLRFDFGVGVSKWITEAKWYQDSGAYSHGTHQWQGSNNASDWTNIGSTFVLGGSTEQTQTELSGNTGGYRYYQLLGISGTWATGPYDREIEFKIVDHPGGLTPGQLTATSPTDTETYVVRVGKAMSTTVLDIEIGMPILIR